MLPVTLHNPPQLVSQSALDLEYTNNTIHVKDQSLLLVQKHSRIHIVNYLEVTFKSLPIDFEFLVVPFLNALKVLSCGGGCGCSSGCGTGGSTTAAAAT